MPKVGSAGTSTGLFELLWGNWGDPELQVGCEWAQIKSVLWLSHDRSRIPPLTQLGSGLGGEGKISAKVEMPEGTFYPQAPRGGVKIGWICLQLDPE